MSVSGIGTLQTLGNASMYVPLNQQPSSLTILLVGLLTFLGWIGLGRILTRRRFSKDPWDLTITVVIGTLSTAFVTELAGIAGIISARSVSVYWVLLMLVGLVEALRLGFSLPWARIGRSACSLAGSVALLANLILLLIALCPSSKIDELYYHMLSPKRLLEDGALVFYRYPWESGILPQMHYQLGLAGTHALGVPDAGNITSWCFSVLTQLLIGHVISRNPLIPRGLPALLGSAASVGSVPLVFHATSGAHAFGYLATIATVIAAAPLPAHDLGLAVFRADRLRMVSWLALAATVTKVTLIPIAGVCLIACLGYEWSALTDTKSTRGVLRWLFRAAQPWLLIYLPLMVYTALRAGSPFGVLFSGNFEHSLYTPEEARKIVRSTRLINNAGAVDFLKNCAMAYAPLAWIGILACLTMPSLPPKIRWYGLILTVVQFGLISFLIQNDIRFVGGYQFGVLAVVASATPDRVWHPVCHKWMPLIMTVLALGPWVLGMGYYAVHTPFAQTAVGLVSREQFMSRYTSLRDDFIQLDDLLPKNAILLVSGVRLNSVSAPRPVIFDTRDPLLGRTRFLFLIGNALPALGPYALGELVYENQHAITVAMRKPGSEPIHGRVRVFRLHPRP